MVTKQLKRFKTSKYCNIVVFLAKISSKGGPKYKITYCGAMRDFTLSKINSWDVKLVCYSKEATTSIFLTTEML